MAEIFQMPKKLNSVERIVEEVVAAKPDVLVVFMLSGEGYRIISSEIPNTTLLLGALERMKWHLQEG